MDEKVKAELQAIRNRLVGLVKAETEGGRTSTYVGSFVTACACSANNLVMAIEAIEYQMITDGRKSPDGRN